MSAQIKFAVAAVVVIGMITSASAGQESMPGRRLGEVVGTSARVNVALIMAETGIHVFYKAYGRWPTSWAEVRQAEIVTCELFNEAGQVIDPDDRSLDFDRDMYYDYHNGVAPKLTVRKDDGLRPFIYDEIEKPKTYREMLSNDEEPNEVRMRLMLDDPRLLKQVSQTTALRMMMSIHRRFKGGACLSIQDFQQTGWCPLAPGTVNPFTGEPYRFDASPHDFYYVYKNNDKGFRFEPLDANGKRLWDLIA